MRVVENSRRVPYLQSLDFYEFTVTCVALVVATVLLVAPLFIEPESEVTQTTTGSEATHTCDC